MVTKEQIQAEQKFMEVVTNAQILASATQEIDLNDLRASWGSNFNTLIITNTDAASAINIYLDGVEVAYVTANNGTFAFDHEYGINYNFLKIENTNAGAAIAAGILKVSVGRTGA